MTDLTAPIIEIFSSFEGEGLQIGEQHLFVRFQDCELSCRFCDTPLSFAVNKLCRVEYPPFSKKFNCHPNPVSLKTLDEIIAAFEDRVIVLTGGEPLQKSPFLKEWLPRLGRRRKILLETAGIHFAELKEIIDWVDIISMDFKLKSSTGMHPWWQEHEIFLKTALEGGKEIYVKTVMTRDTTDEDLEKVINLLALVGRKIPLVLQPASATAKFQGVPTNEQLCHWQNRALEYLSHVRVIPQIHKQMGVL